MRFKRIFVVILDSLGVGEARDADQYNDVGSNTLAHILDYKKMFIPNLKKLGFLNTINMNEDDKNVEAYYTIARPTNAGKDTLAGHYEIIGIKSIVPYKTFAVKGFPIELLNQIERITGRRVIGNKVTDTLSIINEFGDRQLNYGSLIVYTNAASNLQIAAHEDVIAPNLLNSYAEKIRAITLGDEFRIGRIISRPFNGKNGKFKLIPEGREYALNPPTDNLLTNLTRKSYSVIGIGKINDVFNGVGITKNIKADNNVDVINKLSDIIDKDFTGVCIANLNDFDILYGHTRDTNGYANALEDLDVELPLILNKLDTDDLIIITADHGNDPTFKGIDHTRENVPVLIYSRSFIENRKLDILDTMADIGATIADNFGLNKTEIGISFLDKLK